MARGKRSIDGAGRADEGLIASHAFQAKRSTVSTKSGYHQMTNAIATWSSENYPDTLDAETKQMRHTSE